MAYTGHGHHIPGSIQDGTPPKQVARCGGVKLCQACGRDAAMSRHPAGRQRPLFHGYDQPQVTAFMKFFNNDDALPPYLARIATPFADLARFVDNELGDGPEKVEVLNYLLKAKEVVARSTQI